MELLNIKLSLRIHLLVFILILNISQFNSLRKAPQKFNFYEQAVGILIPCAGYFFVPGYGVYVTMKPGSH